VIELRKYETITVGKNLTWDKNHLKELPYEAVEKRIRKAKRMISRLIVEEKVRKLKYIPIGRPFNMIVVTAPSKLETYHMKNKYGAVVRRRFGIKIKYL